MKQEHTLTSGPLVPALLKFTFPILCSMLLQVMYGTVDLLVISNFSSNANISGVNIGSQVLQTVTNLYVGLAMGTTVLLGQYIGANQQEKASRVMGSSIFAFTILAVVGTALLMTTMDGICAVMNTPAEALGPAKEYLTVTYLGSIFVVAYNLLGSIFRGIGDAKTPLITVAIACVANVILDLLFVAVFQWGSVGVASATVIAQAISVFLSIFIIRKKKMPFHFSLQTIRWDWENVKKIFGLGAPVALQSVLVNISFLAVTSIINSFGLVASVAVGYVSKIVNFIMLVPLAFSQALSAFTAQNFGASNYQRAKKGLHCAIAISLGFGAVMLYLSAFQGQLFSQLFTKDPATTKATLEYLASYSIDNVLVPFVFCLTGFFNGFGKTKMVMFQAIIGSCLVRIPLAYLLSHLEGANLFLIGLATPASTAVQIVIFAVYYIHFWKKLNQKTT